jgi:hypothetical protein
MGDYLTATVGDKRRLAFTVLPPSNRSSETFRIESASVKLWDRATGPGAAAFEAMEAEPAFNTEAASHRLSYLWTVPATPGDYQARIRYQLPTADGGELETITAEILVWPEWSVMDAHIAAVEDLLKGPEGVQGGGPIETYLGRREYRDALREAVDALSAVRPREVWARLTRGTGEDYWTLPDGSAVDLAGDAITPAAAWVDLARVKYAVPVGEYQWDPVNWVEGPAVPVNVDYARRRLYVQALPATLEVDLLYSLPHALDHETDTVPADVAGAVREWAAGWLMAGPLANVAAQTNEARVGSAETWSRDMQAKRRQQGRDLMERAAARFKLPEESPAAFDVPLRRAAVPYRRPGELYPL